MQRALQTKAALIAIVFALLMIPLRMIGGIVAERSARQQAAVRDVASASYGTQLFAGPVLSIPYVEEFDDAADERAKRVERRRIERVARFFPATLTVEGDAAVETKWRGLFGVRVFAWRAVARGEFVLDGRLALERKDADSRIVFGKPTLAVVLADPRGVLATPSLQWAGVPIAFERGSVLERAPSGLHAEVPAFDPALPQRFAYSIAITLHGTESLSLVPIANDNRMTLRSDWPHPSFGGQFLPLPQAQRPSGDGFSAQWNVTSLATNAQQQLVSQLQGKPPCAQTLCADRIDIRFIEPIDVYTLSDRALKYGFLFIGLTFGCFALFELVKRLRIHPAQYLLVGLALATFFLLLIGLSEHVAFGLAYFAASAACIALIAYYLSGVLGGALRAIAVGLLLASLYSALYALLVSEDNALLLGSLLVFALLAVAMVLTRRLDWYAIGARDPLVDR